MNSAFVRIFVALGLLAAVANAQQVIALYPATASGSSEATYPEKEYFSKTWNTEVVSNVTKPTLTVYKPTGAANGTAVVICPGGGFMALVINNEGIDVAKWLAARGVTAFVLKYRLAHTGDDATQEFVAMLSDRAKWEEVLTKTVPLAIADGLAAVVYVRRHASEWGVSGDRVGIIGFSAGGTLAAAAGLRYQPDGRPLFVASIYAAAAEMKDLPVPADAPPIFIAAATDDQLGLTKDSLGLYNQWINAHKSAELHIYAQGGHGFGMKKQGTPSDEWINQFGDWLAWQGWLAK
jgi:acetyl esterase/lipase